MFTDRLFTKKLSIKQGEKLLAEYCSANGFGDVTTHWKQPGHSKSKHPFSSIVGSNKTNSGNWVSYHPIRGTYKYTVWINLESGEIREFLR